MDLLTDKLFILSHFLSSRYFFVLRTGHPFISSASRR